MRINGFVAGPFSTNCYVLDDDGRITVVDPGMGAARVVKAYLAEDEGRSLEKIILTHGHIDHTRDAAELANELGCSVHIHEEDAFMLDSASGGVGAQVAQLFDASSMAVPHDVRTYSDTIVCAGSTWRVIHAPGHSPGSVLLVGNEVCLCGDVIFRGAIGRTDLPHSDPQAMQRTLEGPVLGLADGLTLLPGHGPTSTMATERATNPFLVGLQPS